MNPTCADQARADIGPLTPSTQDPLTKENTESKPAKPEHPKGRRKGALNKATLLLKGLLEGQGEVIVQALVDQAKAGNLYALRLAVERLIPIPRERPLNLPRSSANTTAEITAALQAVLDAVADGELTLGEAQKLSSILERKSKFSGLATLEERLAVLEEKHRNSKRWL